MPPISRRAVLANAAAALLLPSVAAFAAPPVLTADDALSLREGPLRDRAKKKGLFYGSCAATTHFDDAPFTQVLTREVGMLVPEWEGKRGRIERQQGAYDFSAADRLVGFAAAHGMASRGHALVWHISNPAWLEAALATRAPSERLLTDYITRTVSHFRGRVQSWDVVNEAIDVKDGRADGLRASSWLKAFGPGYLDTAFQAARAADNDVLLVYNDYGLDTADAWQRERQQAVLSLLEGFRSRGTPCGALGIQAHLKAFGADFQDDNYRRFLSDVAGMGYRILITEMDVDDRHFPSDPAQRDEAVANLTRRYLDIALDQPQTAGVITWGLSDRYTWLAEHPWKPSDLRRARPLPLDGQLRRKPMWHAIAAAFDAAPPRSTG